VIFQDVVNGLAELGHRLVALGHGDSQVFVQHYGPMLKFLNPSAQPLVLAPKCVVLAQGLV
jgi:hypothetical protein